MRALQRQIIGWLLLGLVCGSGTVGANIALKNQTKTNANIHTTKTTTSYDKNDNLKSITEHKQRNNEVGEDTVFTSNRYDLLDRLTQQIQRGQTITYVYDDNGNRSQVSSPAGSTGYAYDGRNRLIQAIGPAGTTTYSYTKDSKTQRIAYPNGTVTEYVYDDADRSLQVKSLIPGNPDSLADDVLIAQYNYSYDKNSNRLTQTTINNRTESTAYGYDAADRLTQTTVTRANGAVETTDYLLDKVGNRTQETLTLDGTVSKDRTYRYDQTHWLTQITDELAAVGQSKTIDYAYDANGNTLSKIDRIQVTPESLVFHYDSRNQLTETIRGPPGNEKMG